MYVSSTTHHGLPVAKGTLSCVARMKSQIVILNEIDELERHFFFQINSVITRMYVMDTSTIYIV